MTITEIADISTISKTIKNNIMEIKLGKIESVKFGLCGYDDCEIGLSVTLSNGSWYVSDFKGYWDAERIKWSKSCQWTEEDKDKGYSETMRYISKLLKEAKVDTIDKLKNIPVEVTFDENKLIVWRILTEVI